jgi:membrane protein DedA with SNARE-associated domain
MLRKVLNAISLAGVALWIAALLFGYIGYLAAYFFTVVFFDAPSQGTDPLYLYLIGSLLSYPLFALAGFFGSSGFWRMKEPQHWRRHLSILPLIPVAAIMIFWLATAE